MITKMKQILGAAAAMLMLAACACAFCALLV